MQVCYLCWDSLENVLIILIGEKGIEFDHLDRPSSASSTSSRPSTAASSTSINSQNVMMQARVRLDDFADKKAEPYKLEGSPPDVDTKLQDVVDDLPDHVLSRSGTPSQWAFDDKDASLKTSPPRPTSATLCSPPVPRKVPISVDHHLRKWSTTKMQ